MDTYIQAGGLQIPIITNYGRGERINNAMREVIDVVTAAPLSAEQINALKTNSWDIYIGDTKQGTQAGYSELLEYHTWFAQPLVDAGVVQQLQEEKEAAVQAKEALQTVTIPTLLRGRTDDVIVEMLKYIPEWTEGKYVIGDVRKYEDQPKICCQAHDSTGNAEWNPTVASLWSPYHAKSAEYALPWIAPTGAHDIYKKDEYMVFTDGKTYKCLSNTNYSPTEYAQAWAAIAINYRGLYPPPAFRVY